mmetsp:Transcript_26725/g.57465  ORF Transcript_26725/g.57465 Transcript_26725/m.57465 type:complete len:1125 (-) Transcript_26725:1193-4567(-)|eukprot:CAMPEP_0172321066 /NCGR_PEP_ID=MMETSP1058-20130122/42198_1 /TAXON_ID=83371 /ORGANISM="Detonula confervacea, Strain CCMP 353" /LENGTH=1124 /DNA_ID=CAMNT_0013036469 /DNA_START=41 /DNA_END=3415 /DNA_ORIENTATION=+
MSNGSTPTGPPRRRSNVGRKESLRLEGLIVEKRLAHVETTRYLVMDFKTGSISVYKKPPPKDEFSAQKRSRSTPSKILSSVANSLTRSSSDEGGRKPQVTCENLAHISQKQRHFAGGDWDPKFTVSASVDWKLRDVENDETMFYLILPANFKKQDSEAEVFVKSRVGRQVSYRSLSNAKISLSSKAMESIDEGEEAVGGTGLDSMRSSKKDGNDDDGDFSVASASSKNYSLSLRNKFKRAPAEEQEVIYQFRVLLDGNEKFIWLQAAAELGRLCNETAVSLVSTTVDVTKKLFVLPLSIGSGGRSNLTALRYAEWARLIDQKKNVSKFHFDVHDIGHVEEPQDSGNLIDDSGRYNTTRLVKVSPTYAYRNRRMTEKDLYHEMTTTSEKWEDFRTQSVGDREEEMIGSLHCEVLACHGLPKLDKLSSTDAVCYFVCGPYAFASDVIDGFLSPVWPSKSRRACVFPIFHAYQKLYAGIFDDDGPGQHDDFAGRVVIDLARLRPNSVYDIFLPLRMYQNTYARKSRGVIHLRLRVEWHDERKALLSYLTRPKKIGQLEHAVTVNCADYKGFRNVVLTVQGKDVPGRYKQLVQKGLQREMKLYKIIMITTMKAQMMDIALYVNPSTSLCVFIAWMHCVYSNSMAYVPVYFVAGIIALLLANYIKYGVDEEFNFGFTPITIKETIQVLLFGGPNTKYIKPLEVTRQCDLAKTARNSQDELDDDIMHQSQSVFSTGGGFQMDGDHMEFPFSEAGRYAKKTLSEACVDASTLFNEDDEEENSQPSGKFSSLRRKAKKSSQSRPKANREDDDDEEDDEFALMVKSSAPRSMDTTHHMMNEQNIGQEGGAKLSRINSQTTVSTNDVVPDKVWKRVKDPKGLPEQDPAVFVKSKKSLKEEILHNKDLLHKYSQRLFDDRMFIVNKEDPGHSTGEEPALNQAIGTNKYKSPIIAKIAEYAAPGLEALKVGLSVWRAVFNLFTWRDPFLTSLFLFGAIFLLCVLIVFPWRLLFFGVGFGVVGPQNWLARIYRKKHPKKKKSPDKLEASQKAADNKSKKNKTPKKTIGPSKNFQFHNHLTTDHGIDVREEKSNKSTHSVHRAVVPNSPLISRRFYDWPPNPSLSKVDIYSEEKNVTD